MLEISQVNDSSTVNTFLQNSDVLIQLQGCCNHAHSCTLLTPLLLSACHNVVLFSLPFSCTVSYFLNLIGVILFLGFSDFAAVSAKSLASLKKDYQEG